MVRLLDPTAAGSDMEAERLAYCRPHMAPYMCPHTVDYGAILPRRVRIHAIRCAKPGLSRSALSSAEPLTDGHPACSPLHPALIGARGVPVTESNRRNALFLCACSPALIRSAERTLLDLDRNTPHDPSALISIVGTPIFLGRMELIRTRDDFLVHGVIKHPVTQEDFGIGLPQPGNSRSGPISTPRRS